MIRFKFYIKKEMLNVIEADEGIDIFFLILFLISINFWSQLKIRSSTNLVIYFLLINESK